jgi:hypothetical protein
VSDLRELGIDLAFEAAIVEYCVPAVKAGRAMDRDLVLEAMNAVIRRRYSHLDRQDVIRAISDVTHARITASGGASARRVMSDSERAAWPVDGRHLLEKFFPKGAPF